MNYVLPLTALILASACGGDSDGGSSNRRERQREEAPAPTPPTTNTPTPAPTPDTGPGEEHTVYNCYRPVNGSYELALRINDIGGELSYEACPGVADLCSDPLPLTRVSDDYVQCLNTTTNPEQFSLCIDDEIIVTETPEGSLIDAILSGAGAEEEVYCDEMIQDMMMDG